MSERRPLPTLPALYPAAATEVVAPRFLKDFRCLAERCEDTCCGHWRVPVDDASLERARGLLASTPLADTFEGALAPVAPEHRPAPNMGHELRMRADGLCHMLDGEQRCSVHGAVGEAALSDICSVFPRTAWLRGGRLELGASLACPEVVRLSLIDEAALDERKAPMGLLPRTWWRDAPVEPNAYGRLHVEVRRWLDRVLGHSDAMLLARAASVAMVAARAAPVFARNVAPVSDEALTDLREALDEAFGDTLAAGTMEQVDEETRAMSLPRTAVLPLVVSVWTQRLAMPLDPRVATYVRAGLASLQTEALGRPAQEGEEVPVDALTSAYERRLVGLYQLGGRDTEVLITNFLRHSLAQHPYTESPTLLDALARLHLRLAALLLLWTADPRVGAMVDRIDDIPPDEALDTLRATFVDAVYRFGRAIAHSKQYTDVFDQALADQGPATLGQVLLLANFCEGRDLRPMFARANIRLSDQEAPEHPSAA